MKLWQHEQTEKESQFWRAVERCLIEFHEVAETKAHKQVVALQKRLFGTQSADGYLIYHDEPFYVACDLMHSQLSLEGDRAVQYDAILRSLNLIPSAT